VQAYFWEKISILGKTYFWKGRPNFGVHTTGGNKERKRRKNNMQEKKQHDAQEHKPNHDRVRVFGKIVMTISHNISINKDIGGLGKGDINIDRYREIEKRILVVITETSFAHGYKNSASSNSNEVIHGPELIPKHSKKVKNYTK
jgi:hypothetical protein